MKIHGFNDSTPPLKGNLEVRRSPVRDAKSTAEVKSNSNTAINKTRDASSASTQKISNLFGDQITISNPVPSQSAALRFPEIIDKIEAGYYNSPEFIDILADKLIEKFYLSGDKE